MKPAVINNEIPEYYCSEKVISLLEKQGLDYHLLAYRDGLLTYEKALRWIRLNFDIWITAEEGLNPSNFYPVVYEKRKYANYEHSFKYSVDFWSDTPEEAWEKGIIWALTKLIKSNKSTKSNEVHQDSKQG